MGYAGIALLLVKYGKFLGPMALKAAHAAGPKVADAWQSNVQVQRAIDQAQTRLTSRSSKTARQIELGRMFAEQAARDQSLPERQELIRGWINKLSVQDMKLQTTANMTSRSAAKGRQIEVGTAVDRIVAEMITTLDAWHEI